MIPAVSLEMPSSSQYAAGFCQITLFIFNFLEKAIQFCICRIKMCKHKDYAIQSWFGFAENGRFCWIKS